MWLIVLEALGALLLFVFLIWWTMFSGRTQGELTEPDHTEADAAEDAGRGGRP